MCAPAHTMPSFLKTRVGFMQFLRQTGNLLEMLVWFFWSIDLIVCQCYDMTFVKWGSRRLQNFLGFWRPPEVNLPKIPYTDRLLLTHLTFSNITMSSVCCYKTCCVWSHVSIVKNSSTHLKHIKYLLQQLKLML